MPDHDADGKTRGDDVRRAAVLDAAMRTFARFGYRKTSMDQVAGEARISRPGLYFLFSSKSGLFQAAAERAIGLDLAAAERALTDAERPLAERVVRAFDAWAGRYVGPLQDVAAVLEDNPGLLGAVGRAAPARFQALLVSALEQAGVAGPSAVARTLTSVSVGLKHQTDTREDYLARIAEAVRLLVQPGPFPSGNRRPAH